MKEAVIAVIIAFTLGVIVVLCALPHFPLQYHYYVVYAWEANDHTITGYGSTELTTQTPLDTLAKIREAEHKISSDNFKNFHAIILNYKELS